MRSNPARFAALVAAAALAVETLAAVEVKIGYDKTFDFKPLRTWAWSAGGPGEVKMARTVNDDPAAMRESVEPVIVSAVQAEMGQRGLKFTMEGADFRVTYYLLLTTGISAQTMGQFLPAVSGWGLPPFEGATQSLKMMNKGSLVLDLSINGQVVWRGLAQTDIKFDADQRKRESLLREAIRDLLAKYPKS